MAKTFDNLKTGDRAYIVDDKENLITELTFKFHGRDSINFVESDCCIFGKYSFRGKTEIDVLLGGKQYKMKTYL